MTILILISIAIFCLGIIKLGFILNRTCIYDSAYELDEGIRYIKPLEQKMWTTTHFKVAELPQFTFNQFLDFYKLNPEHWIIKSDEKCIAKFPIRWEEDKERNKRIYLSFDGPYYKYYGIFFTDSKEYMKYRKWATEEILHQEKETITKMRDYKTKEICDLVQTDIDAIRAEHQKHLENTAILIADAMLKSVGK